MKAIAAFALVLLALPAWPQGIDVAAERARIAAERKQVDARFDEEEKACRARFAVNDCTAEARARQRQALGDLRRQEITLNEMERKRKAAQKLRELEERQSPPKPDETTRQRAASQAQLRESEPRAAGKPEKPAKPAKPARPAASQGQPKAPAVSPGQAAANRRNHEQRMKEAEEHRAKAAKRAAERKKKPAAPLPPPEPDRR